MMRYITALYSYIIEMNSIYIYIFDLYKQYESKIKKKVKFFDWNILYL